MLIVGGTPSGGNVECGMWPGPGTAMVFNLNTCTVQADWDPKVKKEYLVPRAVREVIGGE